MNQVPGWRYGWATPIQCGRKFCAKCGRWRHVCDFQCRERLGDGSARLTTRCTTCLRIDQRQIVSRRAIRERRREYQRIWCEAQRRQAGIPPRNWGERSNRATESPLKQIDVTPFREAFERSGVSLSEVARRLGVDGRTVARSLGIVPRTDTDPRYDKKLASAISYKNALAIVDALGLDRVEMGV